MSEIIISAPHVQAMDSDAIANVRDFECALLKLPQIEISTDHVFHAGVYARTICIPAGSVLTGAEIKIPTLIIANGDFTVFFGDQEIHLKGYHVIPASAGRKQVFVAHSDTYLTMIFQTETTTVEAAENQFTDETSLLGSRKHRDRDTVIVTGE